MKRLFALLTIALASHPAVGAPKVVDHVCAKTEGKETCPALRVRMCTKDGALAACACAPGATEKSGACVVDPVKSIACVVVDTTIGKSMEPFIDFGALEMPPLPTSQLSLAADAVAGREETASAIELADAAKAWDGLEGAAAYEAQKNKGKAKLATRDFANARAIAVRDQFIARFAAHPRLDEVRLGLSRALLRRGAYLVVGPEVEPARKRAFETLSAIVGTAAPTRESRDASFMLAERAVRDKDWPKVLLHQKRVLEIASLKTQADDHALMAAATLRSAQAWLQSGDPARGRTGLEDAITLGMICAPRTECVVAASAARRALAATWATTSQPARSMIATLQKGVLPRPDRVRPLLELEVLYGAGIGAGCKAAAEEARAWEQTFP